MKLKVLDQVHVSLVQADTLRPGQHIEVNDVIGNDLLKAHPRTFEVIEGAEAQDDGEKEASTSPNKAAPGHPDKAAPKPRTKKVRG